MSYIMFAFVEYWVIKLFILVIVGRVVLMMFNRGYISFETLCNFVPKRDWFLSCIKYGLIIWTLVRMAQVA